MGQDATNTATQPASIAGRSANISQPLSPSGRWLNPKTASFLAIGLLVVVAISGYAMRLNARYYANNQPFFDSLGYNTEVHHVMCTCRESGLLAALHDSCTHNTVCLPFLIASFLALFVEPSRMVGIWIQGGELLLVIWSLFYYFTRVRGLSASLAALAVSPFLFLHCLYYRNGGLSDFRMDLGLMLMFSLTATWYLIAKSTGRRSDFVLLGLACGLACLNRGTAPMYFLAVLGPMALADIYFATARRLLLTGLVLAASVAMAVSLWFYVVNFDFLYFYYVVWNTDANAHLPLRESVAHFKFAAHHVGDAALFFAIAFQCVLAIEWLLGMPLNPKNWVYRLQIPKLNWAAIWLAAAPTAMLVLRGAGLNWFVCMPSVFGCVLFLMFPIRNFNPKQISAASAILLLTAVTLCAGAEFRAGWRDHAGDSPESMAAHKATLAAIIADAQNSGISKARFATTHLFYLNTDSLRNVATYDMPDAHSTADSISVASIQLVAVPLLSRSAEVNWRQVNGSTDEEKLDYLTRETAKQLDYIVIPTADSAEYVQTHVPYNVINRYEVELRKRLLASGHWKQISGDIRNSGDEVVRVYRRVDLTATSISPASSADKSSAEIARANSGAAR